MKILSEQSRWMQNFISNLAQMNLCKIYEVASNQCKIPKY
jgi:hypothetical protein